MPERPPRGVFQIFDFTWSVVSCGEAAYAPEFLASARLVIDALNVLAVVSLVCCWAGAMSLLTPLRGSVGGNARALTQRLAALKGLLFAASLLLAMGIVHMSVWLRWGTHFIPDPETALEAGELVGAITAYWGGIFSAMAAAMFIPTFSHLKKQTEEALAKDTLDDESRTKLGKVAEVRIIDWAVRITTIAAPALIGQSGELLTSVVPRGEWPGAKEVIVF